MASRAAQVVTAIAQGTPLLTKTNLERANSMFANAVREYQAADKAEKLAEALKELGEEMPDKTKQEAREDSMGMRPMIRFESGAKLPSGVVPDATFWQALIKRDPLAAELEKFSQTK